MYENTINNTWIDWTNGQLNPIQNALYNKHISCGHSPKLMTKLTASLFGDTVQQDVGPYCMQ